MGVVGRPEILGKMGVAGVPDRNELFHLRPDALTPCYNRPILFMAFRCALLIAVLPLLGQTNETAKLLTEIIRINTSNPPGKEGSVAELLLGKLKTLGFEVDIIPTPEPGKSVFIARLRGDGSKKPILLAAHADVVGW